MKRKGFSPYGPSKAALESMSTICAQELEGTGITLNILLPGGATITGYFCFSISFFNPIDDKNADNIDSLDLCF